MEQKLVRVPFDIELAKKITNKEIEGRIVTRNGMSARIICWDADRKDCIIALLSTISDGECLLTYKPDGSVNVGFDKNANLILEIPEYMTFKDGDIIVFGKKYSFMGIFKESSCDGPSHSDYVVLTEDGKLKFDEDRWSYKYSRFATEEEKQKLIDALKASKDPRAKEYLKRFFGIEEKQEYEFKPFDKVLVRNNGEHQWGARFFDRIYEGDYACTDSLVYKQCIPYNEQTAHLLGTTDDWEG